MLSNKTREEVGGGGALPGDWLCSWVDGEQLFTFASFVFLGLYFSLSFSFPFSLHFFLNYSTVFISAHKFSYFYTSHSLPIPPEAGD